MAKKIGLAMLMILLFFGMAQSKEGWSPFAEGYTSESRSEGVDAGWRMFTIATDICTGTPKPKKLIVYNKLPLVLHLGRWFPMDHLIVVAVDTHNRPIGPVPIVIEEPMEGPFLINTGGYMLTNSRLCPEQIGSTQLRIRDMCDTTHVIFDVKVVPGTKKDTCYKEDPYYPESVEGSSKMK
ncbi:MAG TPA: hypothetical protein VKF36_06305 [Syntrophorhabdales bacterium]|nr:hypothetical protein [Syntrophorhabdales bacterium]